MTTSPRTVCSRLRPWAVALALCAAFLATAPGAHAGDATTGRIDLEATLEPADLAPGGSGTLVVKGTLLEAKHHIYAAGDQAMVYAPIEAAGVTYDLDAKTISPSEAYTDEFSGETEQVWHGTFTLKIPVKIAADAPPGTKLGVTFTYYGCIAGRGCYAPVKNHAATVALAGADVPVAAPAHDGMGTGKGTGGGTGKGTGGGNGKGGGKGAGKGAGKDGGNGRPPVNPRPDVLADTPQVPPAITEEEGGAQVKLDEAKGRIVVTFAPAFGWHFYGPGSADGEPIKVTPKEAEGVTFGEIELPPAGHIELPVDVNVPFTREDSAKVIELEVEWAGCSGADLGERCNPPRKETFRIVWPGGEAAAPDAAAPAEPAKAGDVLFPVVDDDKIGGESESSFIQRVMRDSPLLGFGLIFVFGLGLAFTPCVLPIVPITVSVITGGNADIPKRRLSTLLLTYVAGLALTFALMGVIAALAGGSLSAAFTLPAVQWGISILFIVLAFSMIGVYEIQPPAWLMNLQGGAQKRQGSVFGAFLFGCLGAVIASPCTAPVVAGMLIVTANTGSIPLGFAMFLTLGLGMGAVFYAAGALNFLMRPGPWMVWVRYVFGMLLFGVALYYLRSGGLISESVLWIVGVVVSLLAMLGVAWHLVKKEGEESKPARMRGMKVAVLFLAALGIVAVLTERRDDLLDWIYVRDTQHLVELVGQAKAEGRPAVVDFWAEWCFYCKRYDELIAAEPAVRKRFEKVMRIKVDLTDDAERWDLRHAVGLMAQAQPFLVFIDRQGRIRRKADVDAFLKPEEIVKRLDLVLNSKRASVR